MSSNPSPTFASILEKRLSRRSFVKGTLAASLLAALPGSSIAKSLKETASTLAFTEIAKNTSETHTLPEGFEADVLLRWGDPLFPDAPAFDYQQQTAAAQEKQFGASCDYIALFPTNRPARALLWVNHEYADTIRMFPGLAKAANKTEKHVRIEMAALGGSICEIELKDGAWKPVQTSSYNRRITAYTPMRIAGPAAGHERMKTSYDKRGTRVRGMLSNCAGGVTPWGTVLTCEENFNDFFAITGEFEHAEKANHKRYDVGGSWNNRWQLADERFEVTKEPHEPNRFGWVVEIDPYDPFSMPVKRTALGRFKHETATVTFASPTDKRVVIYSGDDEQFEYLYRFVSSKAYDEKNPRANRNLLDEGTLSVAYFDEFGKCGWLPLVFGQEPLTEKNGFFSQADVLIETRRAADLRGATPMDRPEGITVDERGNVYIAMTKNPERDKKKVDAANPRAKNVHGHIICLLPKCGADGDTTCDISAWQMFLQCGDPEDDQAGTKYLSAPSREGWLSCPDNLTVNHGTPQHLWIATDGQPKSIGKNDGLYVCELDGKNVGRTSLFFTAPRGAEVTGPCFSKDDKHLFLSVQHPAEGDGSTADAPTTRWPDFDPTLPPRSSVIVIHRKDGSKIV